jgi:Tol biopolymer transport system component
MAALALAGCVGLVVWRWAGRGSTTPETRSAPLTRLPGAVGGPAFSPDGNQVAFTWNGEKPDNYDIYLQQIGSGGPHRLTTAPTLEYNPAFSPDGRWIAFLRRPLFIEGRQQDGVFVMPALGGPERMIAPVWVPGLTRALAWGPDSRWLIVAASPSGTEPYALMAYPIDGGEPRKLTNPPAETAVADTSPVLSPDGRQVAFLRNRTWGVRCCGAFADGDVFVLPISRDMSAAGAPRQVSAEKCCVSDVAWERNGEILYVVRRDGAQRVMRTTSSRLAAPRRHCGFAARRPDRLLHLGNQLPDLATRAGWHESRACSFHFVVIWGSGPPVLSGRQEDRFRLRAVRPMESLGLRRGWLQPG